jgi:hypothetical protein
VWLGCADRGSNVCVQGLPAAPPAGSAAGRSAGAARPRGAGPPPRAPATQRRARRRRAARRAPGGAAAAARALGGYDFGEQEALAALLTGPTNPEALRSQESALMQYLNDCLAAEAGPGGLTKLTSGARPAAAAPAVAFAGAGAPGERAGRVAPAWPSPAGAGVAAPPGCGRDARGRRRGRSRGCAAVIRRARGPARARAVARRRAWPYGWGWAAGASDVHRRACLGARAGRGAEAHGRAACAAHRAAPAARLSVHHRAPAISSVLTRGRDTPCRAELRARAALARVQPGRGAAERRAAEHAVG